MHLQFLFPKSRAEADQRTQEILKRMTEHSIVKEILDSVLPLGNDPAENQRANEARMWLLDCCARDPFIPDKPKRDYLGDDAGELQAVREFTKSLGGWARKIGAFEKRYGRHLTRAVGPDYIAGFTADEAERAIAALGEYERALRADLRTRQALGTENPRTVKEIEVHQGAVESPKSG